MLYDENKYFNDIDVMKNVYIFKYTENIYCVLHKERLELSTLGT